MHSLMKKRVLFIHQNLPAQFHHLIKALGARSDFELKGIADAANIRRERWAHTSVELRTYVRDSRPQAPHEKAIAQGLAAARLMKQLRGEGYMPDVVFAHAGWGEALFVKDVFPLARLITYCEFFYASVGADVGFDPEFPALDDVELQLRLRNLTLLSSLEQSDLGISPTRWQRSAFPNALQDKIKVIHDGIDTRAIRPNNEAQVTLLRDQISLRNKDEVVTFVARNLEPYRGFHTFMRSLPDLLRRRPNLRAIVVGGDGVSYGRRPTTGTYREQYLDELAGDMDLSRIHFVGKIPHQALLRILQISTAHVYLTYPFVLSWSMLEAMSAGGALIASRTAPVEEVINAENGMLTDFFDPSSLGHGIEYLCEHRSELHSMRHSARQTIVRDYDLETVCLPKQMALLDQLL
jgi:glycosyltransferase involved in cell wall biosynthesis